MCSPSGKFAEWAKLRVGSRPLTGDHSAAWTHPPLEPPLPVV